ncbi:MAG TPA: phosphoadenosine phosphosulfate reductase family protein [Terriglobales bacterium]|jgi:3'-phosphoadenosine 5'-phosphosulfate sulfotransferase (PAPS reductase)/FAD synthetase|nr:phosphoadenosine phosphosulfate reductase family protein [Terriglobales bacterium]
MISLNTEKLAVSQPDVDLEGVPAETVAQWALDTFSPGISLACSFKAEESLLIGMMHRLRGAGFRGFTLDMGRLDQETKDCIDTIRTRYGIQVEVYFSQAAKVENMVRAGASVSFTTPSRAQALLRPAEWAGVCYETVIRFSTA